VRNLAIRNTHPTIVTVSNDKLAWDNDGNSVTLDESKISVELARLQDEYTAHKYARDREAKYTTWQEQMDQQYWDQVNGTTTWKDAIAKVKSDNPKPTE